jgi:nitrate reductase gamma subunit
VGINSQAHTLFATYSGFIVGAMALLGLALLIYRRISKDRILATTSLNDFVTLGLLFFVVATGFTNVISGLYEHFDILTTIAPWLRGILTLTPDASLMLEVPLRFLVHIWSVPLTYLFRRWIVFRRREASF